MIVLNRSKLLSKSRVLSMTLTNTRGEMSFSQLVTAIPISNRDPSYTVFTVGYVRQIIFNDSTYRFLVTDNSTGIAGVVTKFNRKRSMTCWLGLREAELSLTRILFRLKCRLTHRILFATAGLDSEGFGPS
jgi:hypothetical protein